MASGFLLRSPASSGLQDLRCRTPRCNWTSSKLGIVGGLHKRCTSAVSEGSRRLPKHDAHCAAACVTHVSSTAFRVKYPRSLLERQNRVLAAAAAASASVAGDAADAGSGAAQSLLGDAQRLAQTVSKQAGRFWALSGKFMPMVGLFFMLAFVNTILDSLKDTLVITAVGGGAQVIPYLTVYAVLPSSLVFLLVYSYASQRFRRQALFNGIVSVFMAFFVAFAYGLYPNHHLLHPTGWAEGLAASLPLGLDGAVGMIRNWTFTLFFCISELWGDVCLGLLFWGLANDTTSLADAPTLYPLFGLGANVAQALAGFVLKFFSGPADHGAASFTSEIQSLMGVVLFFAALALGLHHVISVRDNRQRLKRCQQTAAVLRANRRAAAAVAAADADTTPRSAENQMQPASAASTSAAASKSSSGIGSGLSVGEGASGKSTAAAVAAPANATAAAEPVRKRRQSKQSLSEIYRTLSSSIPIRCLVVMSMAQGLCTNLMEFAWKSHIRLLYPTPAAFTSFLGDVSTWQGIVTGLLMVLSPTMFERMGWAGVAAATPKILLYGGGLFFATAMAYQFIMAPSVSAAASAASMGVLHLLVYGGALLYVFSKSAKFSLFKPAEEMVYISLDEEGRTKGKAAIDVVGSQAGKSGGSVLQQVLLLVCGGAIAGQLPMMVVVYLAMSQSWLRSVSTLSRVNNYGHASSVHESIQGSVEEAGQGNPEADGLSPGGGGGGSCDDGNVDGSRVPVTVNGYNGNGNEHNGNGANSYLNGRNGHAVLAAEEAMVVGTAVGAVNGCTNGHANGYSNSHSNGYGNGYHIMNGHNGLNGHSTNSDGVGVYGIDGYSNGNGSVNRSTVAYNTIIRDEPQPAAA